MEEVVRVLSVFIWFLFQTVMVGGIGFLWFLLPFLGLIATMTYFFPQSKQVRGRLYWLGALPLIWIFVGLWGAYFWLDWQELHARNPDWVDWPLTVAIPMAGVLSLIFIVILRDARIFTIAFSLLNFYFVLGMVFLSGMAVTGTWL